MYETFHPKTPSSGQIWSCLNFILSQHLKKIHAICLLEDSTLKYLCMYYSPLLPHQFSPLMKGLNPGKEIKKTSW